MMTRLLATFAVACALALASASSSVGQSTGTVKDRHVLLIVLENENFAAVAKDPYFAQLKKRGKWFSNSQGVTHPSYPNYLALVAGDTFGIHNDHQQDFAAPLRGST